MGAGGKGKGKSQSWSVQKPQLKRNAAARRPAQSPYWDDRGGSAQNGGGGGLQGPPPAGVKIMKKVNWLNRQGYFGKQSIDEDALEMLGTLPEDRAMSILENLEQKAEQSEIWNPNSYVVNAVIRHSNSLKDSGPPSRGHGNQGNQGPPAPVPVMKKVNWLNREGFFGKNSIDEDAVEMLGSLPIDRALSILTNIEEKSQAGEIWNPNSYVVRAIVRHQKSLKSDRWSNDSWSNDRWVDDRRQQKGGKGKAGKGGKGTSLAIRSVPTKGKGKSRY